MTTPNCIDDVKLPKDWIMATCRESYGSLGALGAAILIKTGSCEFEQEDQNEIMSIAAQLEEKIYDIAYLRNPEREGREAKIKEELLKTFSNAGVEYIHVKEVPNEYMKARREPWLVVTTKIGPVKIGWRKRVINIDWSATDVEASANDLFSQENTTKGNQFIHAWGGEAASEYIRKIHEEGDRTSGP